MSDPVVRIKLEYYSDNESARSAAQQGANAAQSALGSGGIGGAGAAAATGALGGAGGSTTSSSYAAGRALAANPEYGGDLFREREFVRARRAEQIGEMRRLIGQRNAISAASRAGLMNPEDFDTQFSFAQKRVNEGRGILNRYDADEDRLGARSYRTEAGARRELERFERRRTTGPMQDSHVRLYRQESDAAVTRAEMARGGDYDSHLQSRRDALARTSGGMPFDSHVGAFQQARVNSAGTSQLDEHVVRRRNAQMASVISDQYDAHISKFREALVRSAGRDQYDAHMTGYRNAMTGASGGSPLDSHVNAFRTNRASSVSQDMNAHVGAFRGYQQQVERANFDADVAHMSPHAAHSALMRQAGAESDPMRSASLRRQAGKFNRAAGWNREVLGMGQYMNLMFGGWEIAQSYLGSQRANAEASVARDGFGVADALMGGIDAQTGGIFGSVVGMGMDFAGIGPSGVRESILQQRDRNNSLEGVRTSRFQRDRQSAELSAGPLGSSAYQRAAIETARASAGRGFDEKSRAALYGVDNQEAYDPNEGSLMYYLGYPGTRGVNQKTAYRYTMDEGQRQARKTEAANAQLDKKAADELAAAQSKQLDAATQYQSAMTRAESSFNSVSANLPVGVGGRDGMMSLNSGRMNRQLAEAAAENTLLQATDPGKAADAAARNWMKFAADNRGFLDQINSFDMAQLRAKIPRRRTQDIASGMSDEQVQRNAIIRSGRADYGQYQEGTLERRTAFNVASENLAAFNRNAGDASFLRNLGLDNRLEVAGILGNATRSPGMNGLLANVAGIRGGAVMETESYRRQGMFGEAGKSVSLGIANLNAFQQNYLGGFQATDIADKNSVSLSGPGTADPEKVIEDVKAARAALEKIRDDIASIASRSATGGGTALTSP
jgi:hypothetical protein